MGARTSCTLYEVHSRKREGRSGRYPVRLVTASSAGRRVAAAGPGLLVDSRSPGRPGSRARSRTGGRRSGVSFLVGRTIRRGRAGPRTFAGRARRGPRGRPGPVRARSASVSACRASARDAGRGTRGRTTMSGEQRCRACRTRPISASSWANSALPAVASGSRRRRVSPLPAGARPERRRRRSAPWSTAGSTSASLTPTHTLPSPSSTLPRHNATLTAPSSPATSNRPATAHRTSVPNVRDVALVSASSDRGARSAGKRAPRCLTEPIDPSAAHSPPSPLASASASQWAISRASGPSSPPWRYV